VRKTHTWQRVGEPEPRALEHARIELHWAAQVPAALGSTLLEARPDASHQSLTWLEDPGVLATAPTAGPTPVRGALRPDDLALLLLDGDGATLDSKPLAGATLGAALDWLRRAVERAVGSPVDELVRPDHELPHHPIADGEPFPGDDPAARAELARWFANAHGSLESLRAVRAAFAPVRCWPHHFDVASLWTLDRNADPERARSIGCGMTPGDASYPEPYFYVLPWPRPEASALPALADGGAWHTEGWTGAVLRASDVVDHLDQAGRVMAFLDSGIEACSKLLGADG